MRRSCRRRCACRRWRRRGRRSSCGRRRGRSWRRRLLLCRLRRSGIDIFNSRAESRGEANDRQREDHQRCDNRFLHLHGDTPFPSENSIESFFSLPWRSHGHSLPPSAPGGGFEIGEKAQQGFGITRAVRAGGQRSFVAGFFGQLGEFAMEPPAERAKPEERAVQEREAFGQRVTPGDVRNFMGDHGVKLGRIPFAPSHGQQNGRAQHAERHRDGEQLGFRQARQPLNSRRACTQRKQGRRPRVMDGPRCAVEAPAEEQTHRDAREEDQDHAEINCGSDGHPGGSRKIPSRGGHGLHLRHL